MEAGKVHTVICHSLHFNIAVAGTCGRGVDRCARVAPWGGSHQRRWMGCLQVSCEQREHLGQQERHRKRGVPRKLGQNQRRFATNTMVVIREVSLTF